MHFISIEGWEINYAKSAILPVYLPTMTCKRLILQSEFSIAHSGFKYIGINFTPDLKQLCCKNYENLLKDISQELA